jgi:hypothetical protein
VKNSIFVIKPYRWEGMWVFDDPAVGLVREPFVGGADTMIDVATAHLPTAKEGFLAVSSACYFPDSQIVLEWVREEGGGNVYRWVEKEMEVRAGTGEAVHPGEGCGVSGVARREMG